MSASGDESIESTMRRCSRLHEAFEESSNFFGNVTFNADDTQHERIGKVRDLTFSPNVMIRSRLADLSNLNKTFFQAIFLLDEIKYAFGNQTHNINRSLEIHGIRDDRHNILSELRQQSQEIIHVTKNVQIFLRQNFDALETEYSNARLFEHMQNERHWSDVHNVADFALVLTQHAQVTVKQIWDVLKNL